MAVVWNITRAADEADAMARELEAQGLHARSLPCIERLALGWPEVPSGAVLFLTSAAALPIPTHARGHPVAALARVAAILRAEGHSLFAESDGGVVSLADQLAGAWERSGNTSRARVLYLCSDRASDQQEHAEALNRLAPFADVTCHAVYRVVAPEQLAQRLDHLSSDSGLVFFSPSAVKHFLAAAARAIKPCAVVAHGASTAREWSTSRPDGWPDAVMHARELPLAETLRRLS